MASGSGAPRAVVYTDGACSGNPGPGGWAWIAPEGGYASGFAPHSTNQRMEIMAAYRAVADNDGPLEVRSDSTYVVKCFNDGWWKNWIAKGWKNSQRKPVANRDLWEPFVELVAERDVTFRWVKGHSGDEWNDKADRLAVAAMTAQEERRGDVHPAVYGPSDDFEPAPAPARDALGPAAPEGHGVVVLGEGAALDVSAADERGAEVDVAADVRLRLSRFLGERAGEVADLYVLTGLRRGAEQLAAEAAIDAGVPYVVVLPYPDPDLDWPEPARARFARLVAGARSELLLAARVPADAKGRTEALAARDRWFAEQASGAVLVWDGRDARLARLHTSLAERLGDEVLVLDPTVAVRTRRRAAIREARRAGVDGR